MSKNIFEKTRPKVYFDAIRGCKACLKLTFKLKPTNVKWLYCLMIVALVNDKKHSCELKEYKNQHSTNFWMLGVVLGGFKSQALFQVLFQVLFQALFQAFWWRLMMIDDDWWWLMMIDDDWWWLMMIDDDWWRLMTIDDDWWQLMTFKQC